MTRKDLILRMVQRLDDDVPYERVIYQLGVLKGVEIGLEQAERGEGTEHEEFMAQLLEEEWQESASSGRRTPKKTSAKSGSGSPAKSRGPRRRSSVA